MTWPAPLERLRRPAYTGENRCRPCTLVNVAIVAVVGSVITVWHWLGGLLAVAIGIALLALRGYVVPATPWFAPRLVDPLPIDFGHSEPSTAPPADGQITDTSGTDPDSEALLAALVDADVLETDSEDLLLDDGFRETWRVRMATLRTASDSTLQDRVAGACPADIDVQCDGDRVLLAGDRDVWLSRAVAIAETAAIEALGEWELSEPIRAQAASPLRTFLSRCPVCGGPIEETTRQNCCGGPGSIYSNPEQPVLACRVCETVVVEL